MTKLPPLVELPTPAADRPSWVKVGVIAAVGFAIGVAWPKLAGVRLGPSAPGEGAGATQTAENAPPEATGAQATKGEAAPSASVAVAPAIPASARTAEPAPAAVDAEVHSGVLLSCRTDDGETLKGSACGSIAVDAIAIPHLKKLGECPAAAQADGKLSVLLHLDFGKGGGRLNLGLGRSSTIAKREDFSGCLSSAFEGVSIGAIAHEHPRYTVAYSVRFAKGARAAASAPTATADEGTKPAAPSASMATPTPAAAPSGKDAGEVVWDVAIIRDEARTGNVVARLPRGTKVRVATFKDGWYQIGYGDNLASEGWVYRRAIGK